jgi:hypothetical protein
MRDTKCTLSKNNLHVLLSILNRQNASRVRLVAQLRQQLLAVRITHQRFA